MPAWLPPSLFLCPRALRQRRRLLTWRLPGHLRPEWCRVATRGQRWRWKTSPCRSLCLGGHAGPARIVSCVGMRNGAAGHGASTSTRSLCLVMARVCERPECPNVVEGRILWGRCTISGAGAGVDAGVGAGVGSGVDSGVGATNSEHHAKVSRARAGAAQPRSLVNSCRQPSMPTSYNGSVARTGGHALAPMPES